MLTRKPDIVLADWRFVLHRHCLVLVDGSEKVLAPKVLDVLEHLSLHYPNVVTHEQLIDEVWQGNHYVGGKALRNTIWQLRQLLSENAALQDAIETVRKGGYRLTVAPQFVADTPSSEMASLAAHQPFKRSVGWKWGSLLLISLIAIVWWHQYHSVAFNQIAQPVFVDGNTRQFPRVSADGKWLLFRALDEKQYDQFFVVATDQPDRPAQQITFDESIKGIATWAPDNSSIYYFASIKNRCVLQKFDRKTQTLSSLTACEDSVHREITISPEGRWLAFLAPLTMDGTRAIHLLDLLHPEQAPQRVSCEPNCGPTTRDRDAAFSPDGRYLAISRRVSDRAEHVFVIDRRDQTQQQITSTNEDIRGISWWPDSQHLLISHAQELNAHLSLVNIHSKVVQSFAVASAEYPSVDALNQRIYFQHAERRGSLFAWHSKTPQQAPSALRRDRFNYRDAAFDRQGQWLAYISNQSGDAEIWLARRDGTQARQLTRLKSVLSFPAWSHDGKRLAFLNSPASGNGNLLQIVDIERGEVHTVKSSFLFHRAPSWSHDDRALLTATGDLRFSELFRITLDKQQVQQLGNNQARNALESAENGLFYFSSKRDGLWQWVDGSEQNDRYIACTKNMIGPYAWTLKTDAIYFVADELHEDVLMRVDLKTQQCQSQLRLPANTVASNSTISFDESSQTVLMTFSERLPTEIYSVKW